MYIPDIETSPENHLGNFTESELAGEAPKDWEYACMLYGETGKGCIRSFLELAPKLSQINMGIRYLYFPLNNKLIRFTLMNFPQNIWKCHMETSRVARSENHGRLLKNFLIVYIILLPPT